MKKYLLAGVITLLPLALTILIVVFLFDFFAAPFLPLVKIGVSKVPFSLPPGVTLFISRLIALILLCLLTLLLGFTARQFIFNRFARAANKILYRIPFVKTVYKVSKDVFSAIFSPDEKQGFKEPIVTPFPHAPFFAIGFKTGDAPLECQEKAGESLVSVFAPTAPHPISGFLFLVPEKNIQSLDMTKEDAFKYLVSCGVILPGAHDKR